MATFWGKLDGKEVYENVQIENMDFTIHGHVETETHADNTESSYFHVAKAFLEFDVGGKTFYAETSNRFLTLLNDEKYPYSAEIFKQIKGEWWEKKC